MTKILGESGRSSIKTFYPEHGEWASFAYPEHGEWASFAYPEHGEWASFAYLEIEGLSLIENFAKIAFAMDIYWGGQALFKIKGKTATIVIDPFDPEIGLKLPKDLSADAVLVTHSHHDHNNSAAVLGNPLVFDGPGEYEVKGAIITGISSFHDNENGAQRGLNTIYQLIIDDVNIVHLGDLGQSILSEAQVAQIETADILLIPVGGVYTISGKIASNIVSQLEPKIIIPMHYKVEGLKFELEGVENFLKEMGAENVIPQPKLTITKDKLPDEPQVVVLSKS
ncbi:MAG: MBL fold metallo-hydrolase [Candidatus Daviesbacteria bacterium]|nr:MAG: MBL fold metallo-hydrolase [Candidatus Daviesbacteria bacterium]